MSERNDDVLIVLREFGNFLRKLDSSDVEKIKSGAAKIGLLDVESTQNPIRGDDDDSFARPIAEKLRSVASREEAREYIEQLDLRAQELRMVAKLLKIYPKSGDSKDRVIDKLVEYTVGLRLRNAAVRGD
jgi:hypothetical protein